eukprot:gene10100-11181_t
MANNVYQPQPQQRLDDFIPEVITRVPFTGRGCVLLAQPGEYEHYLMKAAVLIYEHNEKGSAGLVLDKPSHATMGDAAPNAGPFKSNTLFLGGGEGSDMAIMIHGKDIGGYAKYLGYGVYLGGIAQAKEKVEKFEAEPRDFKFIFNHVSWPAGLLEKEIASGRWDVCAIPVQLLVRQNANSYETLWADARNALRSAGSLHDSTTMHDDEY